MAVTFQSFRGAECAEVLPDVAALRIRLFREWPYLYDGDMDYETEYLKVYARSARSLLVVVRDGDRVIGCATSLPLADDDDAFHAPFLEAGLDVDRIYYLGEILLLPEYRGRGYGHALMHAIHEHARDLDGFTQSALAVVIRDPADPRRPAGETDLDPLWTKHGYSRRPDLTMWLPWKEHGEEEETPKAMAFWLRPMQAA